MQLIKGRPANYKNRLEKEQKIYELLDKLEIEYFYVDHEPFMTMEDSRVVDDLLESTVCKNIFLCDKKRKNFFLLMMPGYKRLDTKDLSKKLECSSLSFAKEEKLLEFLNSTSGSVSMLGLMNDINKNVQLAIDNEILYGEYIGLHPCINTTSLKIRIDQLLNVFLKEIEHDYIVV